MKCATAALFLGTSSKYYLTPTCFVCLSKPKFSFFGIKETLSQAANYLIFKKMRQSKSADRLKQSSKVVQIQYVE